ncbi:histone deacetylase complex subunit SAP18 [Ochromonadaceae sp. CCMP2298]|nr:histone deacetylase complex subunit SAP18 [Ochromonadaceae sp. CCMP2298]
MSTMATMEVDRMKTTPFLLRCFWRLHRNNGLNAYRMAGQGMLPKAEVQIYTWLDASLKELSELLKDAIPGAADPGAILIIMTVGIDQRGSLAMKNIGRVTNGVDGADDAKTLGSYICIGDYIDIAVCRTQGR